MDIKELKKRIETNTLSDEQMIWKIEDHDVWGLMTDESSWFIAKQYIDRIAELHNLNVKYISSWDEIVNQGFVEDDNLYIYKVDELKEYKEIKNSIIVCNKTNKKCIVFPKLEAWQFIDYIKTLVPGMSIEDLEWLATQYDFTYARETWVRFFRFYNDMKKISIFDKDEQDEVFNFLYQSGEYSVISSLTIFDLSNAIVRKDKKMALEVLKVFDYIDSKPHIWLLSILLNKFKNIMDIQLNDTATAESLGISPKQFWVIKKYDCGIYSDVELLNIYKFLTELEYKYKFEGLSTEDLVDYIVCKILGGV